MINCNKIKLELKERSQSDKPRRINLMKSALLYNHPSLQKRLGTKAQYQKYHTSHHHTTISSLLSRNNNNNNNNKIMPSSSTCI